MWTTYISKWLQTNDPLGLFLDGWTGERKWWGLTHLSLLWSRGVHGPDWGISRHDLPLEQWPIFFPSSTWALIARPETNHLVKKARLCRTRLFTTFFFGVYNTILGKAVTNCIYYSLGPGKANALGFLSPNPSPAQAVMACAGLMLARPLSTPTFP